MDVTATFTLPSEHAGEESLERMPATPHLAVIGSIPAEWKIGKVIQLPKSGLSLVESASLKILPAMLVSWLSPVFSASPGISCALPIATPSNDKLGAVSIARTCCVIAHERHSPTELAFLRAGQWTTASSALEDLSSWHANALFSGQGSSTFRAAPNRQLFIMQDTSTSVPLPCDDADSDIKRADRPSQTSSVNSSQSDIDNPGSERSERDEDFAFIQFVLY
ncbi:uncharacterized protein LOC119165508 isoform X2 [Rhipicephalus microplus]|uniref:uncharacterized protein LOC119165508 isoform X2 n=1 Tax=Rhipicephalus microplus TaxID=6941 RepID=UPI001888F479|nr:uncharacterized protein LOC119165508 [Rhipicephalus microplus]